MRSIQRYLLAWMLGALALGGLLTALVTYVVTLEEMNEVFDADLKNVAESVGSYHHSAYGRQRQDVLELPQRTDVPDDVEIVTITWTADGRLVFSSDPRAKVPFIRKEGLARITVEGEEWIVYSNVEPDGVAQAAQRVSQRQQMAGESAVQVFPPMLALVLVAGGLLWYGLRRGLQPLDSTARDVAARSARSMEPIPMSSVPREITPLVASINDLLGRLSGSFSAQRRFLADAAHELRSPVTALRLQLQLLRRSGDMAGREQALQELERGIDRAQRLIEQLLAVARSERDVEATRSEAVDLAGLVRSLVADFSAKAEHHAIDLGAKIDAPVVVEGDPEQLRVLLGNLVENALRYTQRTGTVDVVLDVMDGRPRLRVIDDGPGIPDTERERVFDRFYRGENAGAQARESGGSGLGLAIVRAIAERHRARVSLRTPAGHPGLEVEVMFLDAPGGSTEP